MAWDYEQSEKRIKQHLAGMPEIEVEKLEKEADLENLLSESNCREIYAAHAYVDIANFSRLTANGDTASDLKKLLRAIHIYQRQLAWIIESHLDGVRVHFQGARVHAVFYRPIDKGEALAEKAFLFMLIVRDFVRYVFNPAFPAYENLAVSGGADIGTVIGTQNGLKGDRELLFLGRPANYAAKIIATGLRLTTAMHEALPEALQDACELVDEDAGIYRATGIGKDDLLDLTEAGGIT
ncbi:MAG TPA: hypothetical protein VN181_13870, partial [Thermoanaerobaculia bacterium]|nr:hypothetical protein [Thermoanaerobaculia bacterium]